MMKYTAIDGHVIESKPYPEVVSYACDCEDMPEGIFTSLETTSAATPIGIQQIQITRTVEGNIMTIVIRESSEQELIDYINQVSNAS